MKRYTLLVLFFLAITAVSFCQTRGSIFDASKAETIFGPAATTISIPTDTLRRLFDQSKDVLMFKIFNRQIYILGDKRTPLYPSTGMDISSAEPFEVFSISQLRNLFTQGAATVTNIEIRNFGVMTLRNGGFLMEVGSMCPPYCPTNQ